MDQFTIQTIPNRSFANIRVNRKRGGSGRADRGKARGELNAEHRRRARDGLAERPALINTLVVRKRRDERKKRERDGGGGGGGGDGPRARSSFQSDARSRRGYSRVSRVRAKERKREHEQEKERERYTHVHPHVKRGTGIGNPERWSSVSGGKMAVVIRNK